MFFISISFQIYLNYWAVFKDLIHTMCISRSTEFNLYAYVITYFVRHMLSKQPTNIAQNTPDLKHIHINATSVFRI